MTPSKPRELHHDVAYSPRHNTITEEEVRSLAEEQVNRIESTARCIATYSTNHDGPLDVVTVTLSVRPNVVYDRRMMEQILSSAGNELHKAIREKHKVSESVGYHYEDEQDTDGGFNFEQK